MSQSLIVVVVATFVVSADARSFSEDALKPETVKNLKNLRLALVNADKNALSLGFAKGASLAAWKGAKSYQQSQLAKMARTQTTIVQAFFDGVEGKNDAYGTAYRAAGAAIMTTAWATGSAFVAGASTSLMGYSGLASAVSSLGLSSYAASLASGLGITASTGAPLYGAAATSALVSAVGGPVVATGVLAGAVGGGAYVTYSAVHSATSFLFGQFGSGSHDKDKKLLLDMQKVYENFHLVVKVLKYDQAALAKLATKSKRTVKQVTQLLNDNTPESYEKLGDMVIGWAIENLKGDD